MGLFVQAIVDGFDIRDGKSFQVWRCFPPFILLKAVANTDEFRRSA